ncbi:MAG: hypothetical protein WHZ52_01635 [Armatimonadota bacterium]
MASQDVSGGTGGCPLVVCLADEPAPNAGRTSAYHSYLVEILQHAGLYFSTVPPADLPSALPDASILVTCGEATPPDDVREAIREWVLGGGSWISIAGLWNLEDLLGVRPRPPVTQSSFAAGAVSMGEGYLQPVAKAHPVTVALDGPLHFFNGRAVEEAGCRVLARALDAHRRGVTGPALTENRAGSGRCLLIAPDLTGTVVRIQQGVAITRDGVPAPDGSAPVSDGVLKSDDGLVLDWDFDRDEIPGVPGLRAFLRPVADLWRDLLVRAILDCAAASEVALPLVWFHPEGREAVAHMSNDTDLSDPDCAEEMLKTLAEAGIHSTWCNILPPYPPGIIERMKQAGHEAAMHYDAISEGRGWSWEEFLRQHSGISRALGEAPVSNKNHYLRWEGDTEFFEWLAAAGVTLDQSKGASKTGAAGFNFGTCHPYFPVAPDGRLLDVLELTTPTQDLVVFAPEELVDALIPRVREVYGVLHLLFHPAHIKKPPVRQALLSAVRKAREAGMEWFTAAEISRWECARRQIQWSGYASGDGRVSVQVAAGTPLERAALMWLAPRGGEALLDGEPSASFVTERWGRRFAGCIVDLEPGRPVRFQLRG